MSDHTPQQRQRRTHARLITTGHIYAIIIALTLVAITLIGTYLGK